MAGASVCSAEPENHIVTWRCARIGWSCESNTGPDLRCQRGEARSVESHQISRDARAPWTLSIAYRATVRIDAISPTPGKRVEALRWAHAQEAASDPELAFDHSEIIAAAVRDLCSEVGNLQLPWGLLPAEFTLAELQHACESILGRPLDKSSFRRRLDDRGCVEPVSGLFRGAAHRPAQVYRPRAIPTR